ncbi:GINS complex, Psf1 component [Exidia glandulosa HHB12029]|uniref:DNA replication complex GINS protein PSF1 n=1 Tax=Exidia glandulosa HHB12029 TaxID=1314781 RepID=A0A165J857_EXIGL|nr:GINS complex, Psf1 component [Exidia glandulosa HHB12029]
MSEFKMFGEQAMGLIVEARRAAAQTASDPSTLPPKYSEMAVQNVCRELRMLDEDFQRTLAIHYARSDDDPGVAPPKPIVCAVTMYDQAMKRNKRILLAYIQSRLDRLRDLYWGAGGALAHLLGNAALRERLSPHEVDFLRQYHDMVVVARAEYEFGDILDLTAGIDVPPKELHVDVRVLKDIGDVHTEQGTIDFRKGQRFQLRRPDIEHLIVQGYLEEIRH